MHNDRAKALFRIMLLGIVGCSSAPASACSIPVFRYALDYWTADRYEVVIFHRGPLGGKDQAVAARLERAAGDDTAGCNITVHLVDLDGQPDRSMQSLWEAQATSELPWMVARYPVRSRPEKNLWAGRVDESGAELLVDSPVRREIARGIASGQAAVWVLLESGNRAKDEAACELLRAQLAEMEGILTAAMQPEDLAAEAEGVEEGEVGVQITFSLVRVSRSDPAERVLVNLLLDSEEDLRAYSGPMAFPVFGRGRVLYALVDRGISERNIRETCSFLVEGCSCLIKAANPGTDLIMRTDWEAAIRYVQAEMAEVPSPVGPASGGGLAEASFPGMHDDRSTTLLRNSLLGMAGGLIIVAVAAWILTARDRSRP